MPGVGRTFPMAAAWGRGFPRRPRYSGTRNSSAVLSDPIPGGIRAGAKHLHALLGEVETGRLASAIRGAVRPTPIYGRAGRRGRGVVRRFWF